MRREKYGGGVELIQIIEYIIELRWTIRVNLILYNIIQLQLLLVLVLVFLFPIINNILYVLFVERSHEREANNHRYENSQLMPGSYQSGK